MMLDFFLFAFFGALVSAHYNLKEPMPYNVVDCNRPKCWGPCPEVWQTEWAKARNSPYNPSKVWRRGQLVDIKWHRNNHDGGFYRRSLVPVNHMFDFEWHKKSAFEYGCWTQGLYRCGYHPSCGTDTKGFAYKNKMIVPKVFPDGDYVFAMVWYGGLHWQRKRAFFSDYWTCAFVRIRGGPLAAQHTPQFVPGRNYRTSVPAGKCVSTSLFVLECGGTPCFQNPVRTSLPGVFLNGRIPKPLYARDFIYQTNDTNNRKLLDTQKGPQQGKEKVIRENELGKRRNEAMTNEKLRAKRGRDAIVKNSIVRRPSLGRNQVSKPAQPRKTTAPQRPHRSRSCASTPRNLGMRNSARRGGLISPKCKPGAASAMHSAWRKATPEC